MPVITQVHSYDILVINTHPPQLCLRLWYHTSQQALHIVCITAICSPFFAMPEYINQKNRIYTSSILEHTLKVTCYIKLITLWYIKLYYGLWYVIKITSWQKWSINTCKCDSVEIPNICNSWPSANFQPKWASNACANKDTHTHITHTLMRNKMH